jgi:hypothetical protein
VKQIVSFSPAFIGAMPIRPAPRRVVGIRVATADEREVVVDFDDGSEQRLEGPYAQRTATSWLEEDNPKT